jgi:hypothetical protein
MRLECAIAVRHPIGTSDVRRRRLAHGALWYLIAGLLCAPLVTLGLAGTDAPDAVADNTRILVRLYAFEAFPQWALVHHEEACPQTIDELSPFVNDAARDSWGTALELRCGGGIRGAYVRSAGPDRRFETGDDITSND